MPKYALATPVASAAEIARIRDAAHRYLLAGGAIFPGQDSDDLDEHIATVRDRRHPQVTATFEKQLEAAVPSGPKVATHQSHEDLWSVAWELVGAHAEAGYLFGVFVGLEVAALTRQGASPHTASGKKGGRR